MLNINRPDDDTEVKSKSKKEDDSLLEGLDDQISGYFIEEDEASEEDDDDDDEEKKPINKKLMGMVVGVVALVAVVGISLAVKSSMASDVPATDKVVETPAPTPTPSEEVEVEETEPVEEIVEETIGPDGLTDAEREMYNENLGIGIKQLTGMANAGINDTPITGDDFTKDFQSTDIPMFYDIKSIRYEKDFISYTKYRTTTADGIELYWLDGVYQGKPCRLTIGLGVYKDLPASGVVPVEVEVTITTEGNQIVTGFYIDYSSLQTNSK